jgi:hypothetical protein
VKQLIEILEQKAVFDGKPRFMDGGAVINLLNHYSYGGSSEAITLAKEDGCENPKEYIVTVRVEVEEI